MLHLAMVLSIHMDRSGENIFVDNLPFPDFLTCAEWV